MGKIFYNLTLEDLCDLMCGGVDPDEFETGNSESEQEVHYGNNNQPCK